MVETCFTHVISWGPTFQVKSQVSNGCLNTLPHHDLVPCCYLTSLHRKSCVNGSHAYSILRELFLNDTHIRIISNFATKWASLDVCLGWFAARLSMVCGSYIRPITIAGGPPRMHRKQSNNYDKSLHAFFSCIYCTCMYI